MKQKFTAWGAFVTLLVSLVMTAPLALAAAPVLAVTQNGNTMTLNVTNADHFANITLYQRQTSQFWTTTNNVGTTDSTGSFSGTQPLTWDGSSNPLQIYVAVDNLQSPIVYLYPSGGCTTNCGGTGSLTLSQTTVNLNVGQSTTVTASPTSGAVYVSGNTNNNAISYSLSGNQITIFGNQGGTSTLTICSTPTQCNTIQVGVNSSTASFTASQNTVNVASGQTATVTISGATGSLYISNNTNSAVASASISGSVVTIFGVNTGVTTLSVCQNSSSSCTSITVNVNGGGSSATGGVSFGNSTITLSVGQSQNVTSISAANGSNSFYVSSNSNPSVASAGINGSLLYVSAIAPGTTTVTVCENGYSYCGSTTITIAGSTTNSLTLNPSSLNLNVNQSSIVTVSGGNGNYSLSLNTSPSVAAVSLSGTTLFVTGLSNGSTSATICQSSGTTLCNLLPINVGAASTTSGNVTFSTSTPEIAVGQNLNVTIYSSNGYSGAYSIAGNTNAAAVNTSFSGSTLTLVGQAAGTTFLTICQSNSATCGGLTVTVDSGLGNGSVYLIQPNLPTFTAGQAYSYQLQAAGGTGVYNFSISSGSLPAGLTLSNNGLISGTPTSGATATFTIIAADNSGKAGVSTLTIPGTGATTGSNSGGLTIPTTSSSTPNSSSGFSNGQLIKENNTIYIVYKNTKVGFTNAAAFLGLGYKFSNVTDSANSGLTVSDRTVVTASGAHPRGAWIVSGKTVYFVTPEGNIPVPTWDIFLANGGQANMIVPANRYDIVRTKLPAMTPSDTRLQ